MKIDYCASIVQKIASGRKIFGKFFVPLHKTTNDMTQTEQRIREMEQRMDKASTAVMQLSAALDGYTAAQEAIRQLSAYYGSDEWKQDLADDEAGRLPQDLKRGVLSEDGIWNLLEDNKELLARIREMVSEG
jgi:hypothetical protein